MFYRSNIIALAVLVLASLAHVWKYVQGSTRVEAASWDIYAQAYPTMIQAVAAIRDGGRGLLWNAMQNCGQPFFGSGITGLLYPGNLAFFVTDPDRALYAMLAFNFVVACVSAYVLCLELGLGGLAACCGGLCFGLGASSVSFATAAPLLGVPYVWFPAAMLFCERILRTPSLRSQLGLAVTIALALIPGPPQFVFYLLLLMIGARLLWELATRRHGVSWRTLVALIGGLILGPLLVAVQLIPAFEVARQSVGGRALALDELTGGGFLSWELIRNQLAGRWDNGQPFLILPCMLAAVAWLHRPARRILFFYALIGVLALDLALGSNGFSFALYSKLPFVTFFRIPSRMLAITSFSFALLAAGGVEAMMGRSRPPSLKASAAVAALLFAGLMGMRWLIPNGLDPSEWSLGIAVLVAGAVSAACGRLRPVMGPVIIAALFLHLVSLRGVPLRQLLPDGGILFAHQSQYAALQREMTEQDRTYVVPRPNDHRLQQKTGALFGVPAVYDDHPQTAQRFADYFSTLRTGSAASDFIDRSDPVSGLLPRTLNQRLLNLAGGRFVLVPSNVTENAVLRSFQFDYDLSSTKVHIYRNLNALPRAFFVPRVEIVPDATLLLQRLANGKDNLRQVALVEAMPASGFMGAALPISDSTVTFVRNDPEHITLRVSAVARGFVFLADQYFPGWYATVNDAPTPIERANYIFRLVPVPAGDSVIDFQYRPASLKLGAATSIIAWIVAAGLLFCVGQRGARVARRIQGCVEAIGRSVRPADRTMAAARKYSLVSISGVLFAFTVWYCASAPYNLYAYDEGYFLYEAKRIVDGDVFYRDFFNIVTPLAWYVMAGAYWLFGVSMTTARTTMAVVHGIIAVGALVACRNMGVRLSIAAIVGLSESAVCYLGFEHALPHWFGTLFCVFVLVALLRAPLTRTRHAFVVGALVGGISLTQQQRGVAMAWVPIAVAMCDHWLAPAQSWRRALRVLAAYASGLAAVLVPAVLALVVLAGFENVFDALVRYPLVNYRQTVSVSWGAYNPLQDPYIGPIIKYLSLLVPAVALLRCAWLWTTGASARVIRPLAVAWLTSIGALLGITYAPGYGYLVFVGPIWFLLLARLAEDLFATFERRTPPLRVVAITTVAAFAVLFAVRLGYRRHERNTQWAYQAETPYGPVNFTKPTDIVVLQAVQDLVGSTRELFIYPTAPGLYLLTGTKNVTRFQIILPGYSSPEHMQEIIDTLERRRQPYVVRYWHWIQNDQDPILTYLMQHYERVPLPYPPKDFRTISMFRRKPDAVTPPMSPER